MYVVRHRSYGTVTAPTPNPPNRLTPYDLRSGSSLFLWNLYLLSPPSGPSRLVHSFPDLNTYTTIPVLHRCRSMTGSLSCGLPVLPFLEMCSRSGRHDLYSKLRHSLSSVPTTNSTSLRSNLDTVPSKERRPTVPSDSSSVVPPVTYEDPVTPEPGP